MCPDTAELQAMLDRAVAGEIVLLGACTVSGPLVVPAGVELRGRGEDTVLDGASGQAVRLEPGTTSTALSNLVVRSRGCAAVVAQGLGQARIEDVRIVAERGVGVALETQAELTNVALEGALTATSIEDTAPMLPPYACGSGDLATHGLVLVDSEATLVNVSVSGFAAFGALSIRSNLIWRGGGVRTNLGAGLEVVGGTADLEDLALDDTHNGVGAIEAYSAIFVGPATVTSVGLEVTGSRSYGLFHAGEVDASHSDFIVSDNVFAGVWAQDGASIGLLRGTLERNGFAAVAAFDSPALGMDAVLVADTTESAALFGLRTVRAADGLHLVRSAASLRETTFSNNGRVGMLVDLGGGSTDELMLAGLVADGAGAALGVVAQNGMVVPGWDVDVDRQGATAANDLALAEVLDIAEAVGPPCLPALGGIDASGLAGLVD